MPFLKVIKGGAAGQLIELAGERTIFGRHPSSQVVLDNSAISRHHAQILENHGTYYLEDLRSRNGTHLNEVAVRGRLELRDADEIKLCDYVFLFLMQNPAGLTGERKRNAERPTRTSDGPRRRNRASDAQIPTISLPDMEEDSSTPGSSIISSVDASSVQTVRYNVRPEIKLRAVLEISVALGRVLKLDDVLPVLLASLFKIFPQADAGFVLLKDHATEKLQLRASLQRTPDDEQDVPVSMTIVKLAMDGKRAVLSADASGDSRFETSESIADMRLHSVMCVPLVNQSSDALGVIQLSTADLSQQFSADDLDLLASVSAQAALAVENATLHESLLMQRDLDRELEFATQVQLGFLPSEPPRIDGYEFADYYEPAHRVGGDYFDYVPLPNGNIAVAVGDVAGKGVPAALLMARLHASARYHLLSATNPAEAMTSLNAEIATSGLGFRFITLIMVVVNVKTHQVHVANAGHLPPLLRHPDGTVEPIGMKESGMPLGLGGPQTFCEMIVPLEPGADLVFYTDGVTEAMDDDYNLYGRVRLANAVKAAPSTAAELVKSLVADVEGFYGELPQRDDLCIVAIRRT